MSDKQLIKWAGGKTSLLSHIMPHLQGANRLLEPFFGSGAIAGGFTEKPAWYIAADINPVLVKVHELVIKKDPKFIQGLNAWFAAYRAAPVEGDEKESDIVGLTLKACSERSRAAVYYCARLLFNEMGVCNDKAVLFVFLNRTCFRGLWRENKAGKMNVPFGHYKPDTAEVGLEEIERTAERLAGIQLEVSGFEEFLLKYKPALGDVVYCDPPYWAPEGGIFADYDKSGFGRKETERLLELLLVCRRRGAKVVLSNAPSDWLRNWCTENGGECITMSTRRRIKSRGAHDIEDNEVLIILGN